METTVYRVQHKATAYGPYFNPKPTAYGPYFNPRDTSANWLQLKHSGLEAYDHPEPCEDGLKLKSKEQVCGMVSAQKLERWFDGCGTWLDTNGFVVAVHLAPAKGKYRAQVSPKSGQVVFWPNPNGAEDYMNIWWK